MQTSFHFVNGIQNDSASRKLMRRHVMKGKNAGKRLHRPSRLRPAKPVPRNAVVPAAPPVSAPGNGCVERQQLLFPCLPGSLGDAFSGLALPIYVTSSIASVINEFFSLTAERVYPPTLGISVHNGKRLWLSLMFVDESSCHCNVALMQAMNEVYMGSGGNSPKALYYLSQTIARVKERVEGGEALSDSTMGIVLSLILQEQLRQDFPSAQVHTEGLQRMVLLRGGLDQLENHTLVLKICKTDIIYSLQTGRPPSFSRNRMAWAREALRATGLDMDSTCTAGCPANDTLQHPLREVLGYAMGLTVMGNTKLRGRSLDLWLFQEVVISIIYRLLSIRSLEGPRLGSSIQEAYHVGLIIFTMTIFTQSGRRRILKYPPVTRYLRDCLAGLEDSGEDRLRLWLLLVGAVWTLDEDEESWIMPDFSRATQRMGLQSWDHVHLRVAGLPWICRLHDDLGKAVWQKSLANIHGSF